MTDPVVFTVNVDGDAEQQLASVDDAFRKLDGTQDETADGASGLTNAWSELNQGLEVGKKVLGALNTVLDVTKKYTIDIATETAAIADPLGKTSRAYGVSTDYMQAFIATTAQYSGVEAPQAQKALLNIERQALGVKQGLAGAKDSFDAFGVSALDSEGNVRPVRDIVADLSTNLRDGLIPESEAAAASADLLGDRTGRLLLSLQEGPEIFDEVQERMERYGALMSEELIKYSEEYNDSVQRREEAEQGWKNAISEGSLPALAAMNNLLAETIGSHATLREEITDIADRVLPLLGHAAITAYYEWGQITTEIGARTTAAVAKYVGYVAKFSDLVGADEAAAKARGLAMEIRKSAAASHAVAAAAERQKDAMIAAYDAEIAKIKERNAAAGGGGGGGGAPPPGGETADEEIVISTGTTYQMSDLLGGEALVKTTAKATTEAENLGNTWTQVGSTIASTVSMIKALADSEGDTGTAVANLVGGILSNVGQIVGGPVGGALGVAGQVVTAATAMADEGIPPHYMRARRTVTLEPQERVLPTEQSAKFDRAVDAFDRWTAGLGTQSGMSRSSGGGSFIVPAPVVIDFGSGGRFETMVQFAMEQTERYNAPGGYPA
jgi:hypothetical protein